MESKVIEIRSKFLALMTQSVSTPSGRMANGICEGQSGPNTGENALDGPGLALLGIFQMLRTGMLGIPGLARYMQMCRRTRDDARIDRLWRIFIRAKYPNHPFEKSDRGREGSFSSFGIMRHKLECRSFPCCTQLDAQILFGRNDFKIVCTQEESHDIIREVQSHVTFTGGFFPEIFTKATKELNKLQRLRTRSKSKRRPLKYNDSLVVIDLCRPYLVSKILTPVTKKIAVADMRSRAKYQSEGHNDNNFCEDTEMRSRAKYQSDGHNDNNFGEDTDMRSRAKYQSEGHNDNNFWEGRTENFANLKDYRKWWYRMQVCFCTVRSSYVNVSYFSFLFLELFFIIISIYELSVFVNCAA